MIRGCESGEQGMRNSKRLWWMIAVVRSWERWWSSFNEQCSLDLVGWTLLWWTSSGVPLDWCTRQVSTRQVSTRLVSTRHQRSCCRTKSEFEYKKGAANEYSSAVVRLVMNHNGWLEKLVKNYFEEESVQNKHYTRLVADEHDEARDQPGVDGLRSRHRSILHRGTRWTGESRRWIQKVHA